jgi:hypothetical protein
VSITSARIGARLDGVYIDEDVLETEAPHERLVHLMGLFFRIGASIADEEVEVQALLRLRNHPNPGREARPLSHRGIDMPEPTRRVTRAPRVVTFRE